MTEIASPEIGVETILHNLREEIARHRAHGGDYAASFPRSLPDESFSPSTWMGNNGESFRLQPPFVAHPDHQYQIHDLTQYHDAAFIANAYQAILHRPPDEQGFRHSLDELRAGRFNKIDILAGLLSSSEGVAGGARIEGLRRTAFLRRLGRLPLIGYPLRVLMTLARLPHLVRHHQQLEAYTAMQDQHLAEQIEYVKGQLRNAAVEADRRYGRMRQFTEEAARAFAHAFAAHDARLGEHGKQMDEHDDRLERQLTQLNEIKNWQSAQHAQLQSRHLHLAGKLEELRREVADNFLKLQNTRRELTMQERRLGALLEKGVGGLPGVPSARESLAESARRVDDHFYDAFYASFEDLFRGSREDIKERLQVHLATLIEAGVKGEVLDLGCGRGEWLELLGEHNLSAKGVDLNRIFVEECRGRNLEVSEGDALASLRALPDDSLGAVTSFHLIEHLPFETLVEMIDEILRVLRPGGVVIFETPNPENFSVGSYFFYTDPTHRHPLPSQTMRFVMESRGFSRLEVIKLHPAPANMRLAGDTEIIKRFNEYFYGPFDYAIVGRKI